jgi:hypothetical protein
MRQKTILWSNLAMEMQRLLHPNRESKDKNDQQGYEEE